MNMDNRLIANKTYLDSAAHHGELINRIYHRSLMQTEKSQPKGKRIMPETRFTEVYHNLLPIGIGDRCLIIFPTYDIKIIIIFYL